jgi:hypothetical protein
MRLLPLRLLFLPLRLVLLDFLDFLDFLYLRRLVLRRLVLRRLLPPTNCGSSRGGSPGLKTNGFEILYIEPNWLFIQWDVKGAKSLTKNTNVNKPVDNQYKSTDTYKPSGNLSTMINH